MKLVLDSEITLRRVELVEFETFMNDISLSDILVLKRIVDEQLAERVDIIDKRTGYRR